MSPSLELGGIVGHESLGGVDDILLSNGLDTAQIVSRPDVGRMQPQAVEDGPIIRHMPVGMLQQGAQMFHLIRLSLFRSPELALPNQTQIGFHVKAVLLTKKIKDDATVHKPKVFCS